MKHYIFDMGGVISISMDRKFIYQHLDLNIDYEKFKYIFSDGEEAQKIHKGLITLKQYFKFLTQFMNTRISFEKFMDIYKGSKKGLYKDTVEIIKQLKIGENKVYLLSNLREIDFELFKEKFDVSLFDKMFLSYEIGMIKPNDNIYQYVIKNIGDIPQNLYFFDDNENNVEAALENGINAFQVTGENIKEIFCKKIDSKFFE